MNTGSARSGISILATITAWFLSLGSYAVAGSAELAPFPFGGHVHALAVTADSGELLLGARPIYRSADGGDTWSRIDDIPVGEVRANFTSIAVDVRNPGTVYASGHGVGVVKSVDGGATWTTKSAGLGGNSTEALAIDARDSDRLYVWVLGDGLYRSEDAAETWRRVDDGPKQQEIRSLVSVDVPTGMGGIWLYAGLDTGVVKSPDCFCGWDRLQNVGLPENRRVYSLAVDPGNPSTLFAGMRAGVFKTTDAGKSWRKITGDVADAVVTVDPRRPGVIYAAGSDGVLLRSEDAGESWQRRN